MSVYIPENSKQSRLWALPLGGRYAACNGSAQDWDCHQLIRVKGYRPYFFPAELLAADGSWGGGGIAASDANRSFQTQAHRESPDQTQWVSKGNKVRKGEREMRLVG